MVTGLLLLLSLLLSSCTVLSPQDTLFPSIKEEIPLHLLDEEVHIVGYLETQISCIELWINPIFAALGQPMFGCSGLFLVDVRYECTIYMAYDWNWLYEHEHRHCLGYSD